MRQRAIATRGLGAEASFEMMSKGECSGRWFPPCAGITRFRFSGRPKGLSAVHPGEQLPRNKMRVTFSLRRRA